MQIFLRPIFSPEKVFVVQPPNFCKNLVLEVGNPKDSHQGSHVMSYTKFGVGRSFFKIDGGAVCGGVQKSFNRKFPTLSGGEPTHGEVGYIRSVAIHFVRCRTHTR